MSDSFYRSIIEQTPVGFCSLQVIKDEVGNLVDYEVLDTNTAIESILGLTREKTIGKRMEHIYPGIGDVYYEAFEALKIVAMSGGTKIFTQYLRSIDIWLEGTVYSPQKDIIVVFLSDISLSMKQFSNLDIFFNISQDLLSISKLDGSYIKVNPAWQKVMGYTKEEVIGKNFSQFVHSEDLNNSKTITLQLQTQSNEINFVNRYLHKDGSYHYLEWDAQSDGRQIYSIARDITERQLWEKKIEYISYHDVVTGLYNRRFLEEEIKRMNTSRNLPISIIMGDVNRLKLVNDAFGHEKGDELILKAAQAIKISCRPEDLIARWGGDEFMIFLPKTNTMEAEKIIDRIHKNCDGQQVNSIAVSVAFGIAEKISVDVDMSDVMREAENAMYKAKAKESERNRNDIINVVINTLYQRNPYEEKHAKHVSFLCRRTAEELGCSEDQIQKIALAGLMHDIGKVAVSVQILEKPSQLNENEWQEIRKHAEIGYKVVGDAQEMVDIGNAILAHHERVDGKGYPKGSKQEDIPIAARIIAVADSYDTMTSQSFYHKMMTKEMAIAEIRKNAGTQFDTQIAETFIEKVLLPRDKN